MASEITKGYLSLQAAADLSAKQFYLMRVTASEAVNVTTAATQVAIGVLQNKPASGEVATLSREGDVTRVVVGAAIAAGASVTSDAAGKGATGTTGNKCAGVALTAASADGEVIEMYQVAHVAA